MRQVALCRHLHRGSCCSASPGSGTARSLLAASAQSSPTSGAWRVARCRSGGRRRLWPSRQRGEWRISWGYDYPALATAWHCLTHDRPGKSSGNVPCHIQGACWGKHSEAQKYTGGAKQLGGNKGMAWLVRCFAAFRGIGDLRIRRGFLNQALQMRHRSIEGEPHITSFVIRVYGSIGIISASRPTET